MVDLLKQVFSLKGLQNFLRVRDDDGNFDPLQVKATLIQTGIGLGILFFLWLFGAFS